MKAQILKISGHKNEKDFYKEFPTMEAFMAKHGAALRKAQNSLTFGPQQKPKMVDSNNNGIPDNIESPQSLGMYPDPSVIKGFANPTNTGQTAKPSATPPGQAGFPGTMFKPSAIPMQSYAEEKGISGQGEIDRIMKGSQEGSNKAVDTGKAIQTGIGMVDSVVSGVKALGAEKKALKSARTWRDVSGVARKASETEDVNTRGDIADTARRTRKALMPTVSGEELFPVQGVGTNVLAKSGKGLPTGGLKRSEDYGSKSKPYASVKSSDFAGGGRSYPIPTIQDAGDALRLAGLHGREDVKAKVYAKYPELRKGQDGERMRMSKENYIDPNWFREERRPQGGGYTFGSAPDPYAKVYGVGAWGNQRLNDRLSMSGNIDTAMVTYPGGHEFTKPSANLSLKYRFQDGGEIANTFAPDDIYTDMGYEPFGESEPGYQPLPDSEIIKAYRSGGLVPRAQGGFGFGNLWSTMGAGGAGSAPGGAGDFGGAASSVASGAMGNNAGTQIGGGIGEAAGSMFGPLGGTIGKAAGSLIGGALDTNPQKIKKAQKAMMANMDVMSGMGDLRGFRAGSGAMEHGGAMHEYPNPQIISYFGNTPISEAYQKDPMMNTLRSGGNLRKNEVGDIRIDPNRGKLRPMSFNPYTAGTGVTSMIEGPSHNRGGVNINYNGNMVEAEGGEPISERQDGGDVGDTSAVITGDQTFNKMGGYEMPELSEYVGRKAKYIQKDLANKDARLNKLQAKNSQALAESNPITPIDKLTFNSLTMNEKGIDHQYKRNALKTQSLIAYQDAINEEAESRGLDAGALSRGQIKPLPFNEMKAFQQMEERAQTGYRLPRDTDEAEYTAPTTGYDMAKAIKELRDLQNKAATVYKQKPQASYYSPEEKGASKQPGYTKPEPLTKVKNYATPPRLGISNVAASNVSTMSADPTGSGGAGDTSGVPKKPKAPAKQQEANVPNTKDLPPLPQEQYDELMALYKEAEKYPDKKSPQTLAFQKRYHELAPDYARAVLESEPITAKGAASKGKLKRTDLESNEDEIFGKRTKQYMASLKAEGKPGEKPKDIPGDTPKTDDEDGVFETAPGGKNQWATLAGQLLPWLRKTPGEGLLGDQLAGEMFALQQHEEPVQARFYHPQLDTPYDISFQDRLNENQATFNSLERAAGSGNPEALAMLAGQKYGADSNVLAEQFRANQAKKDQVYSQNRQTLNQAQQYNLGVADQQYVRQSQAKSNTKLAKQEAINSIAAKIGQNRLENRTLQTYSNMFPDFSFGKDYNIRKTGAPTTFNMPVVYNAAGDITHVALYDENGKIYDYRPITEDEQKTMSKKKTTAKSTKTADQMTADDLKKAAEAKKERNGGIVKAFKNL